MSSFFKLQTYVQTNKNAKVKRKKYFFIILSILKTRKFLKKKIEKTRKQKNINKMKACKI